MEQKTLEQALVQIIEKAVQGIDSATAFIQAELPDVVQQLLVWHAVESFIWAMMGPLLVVTYWGIYWRFGGRGRKIESRYDNEPRYAETLTHGWDGKLTEAGFLFFLFGGGISHSIGLVFMMSNLVWLKILLAPKLYLLEYAAKLVQ